MFRQFLAGMEVGDKNQGSGAGRKGANGMFVVGEKVLSKVRE